MCDDGYKTTLVVMRKIRGFQVNMCEQAPIYFMVSFLFMVLSIGVLVWDTYLDYLDCQDVEKHNRDFEKERLIDVY